MFLHHHYYCCCCFYAFPEDGFCSLAMWRLDGIPKGAHNRLACVEQTWLSVEVGLKNKQWKVEILFHSLPLGASHFWIAHLSMPANQKPQNIHVHPLIPTLVVNGPFVTNNFFNMNFCCYQVYNCEHVFIYLFIYLFLVSNFFDTENLEEKKFQIIMHAYIPQRNHQHWWWKN
jgi:hypothetical protein